ncbi:methyltransferase TRM13-domain-containing protein [Chytridium lagenaria]|nr:methyltransferase TRM13-domain-containing protein [Chytridium lagenaria]
MILSHPSLSSKLDTTSFGKHAHQHSTLLGHIEKMGCLDKTNVFLELGAGKAEFSHHVHMAVGNPSKFILLDRKATRLKVNRSKEDISPAGTWERVLMDLKDFNLGAYPVEHFKDAFTGIFAFSKHLCGAATDMGLRCLTNYATQIHPLPLKGILIALCCHHQCNFRCYVNHEFIRQLKLTDEDFAMLKSLSSWAISGKACKHILNIGRLKYLEQLGFNAKLVEYVDPKYTLENVALVVLPKTIKPHC